MIKVLELFKGTGSVGKYCSQFPDIYEVISLDIEPRFKATFTESILTWDYKKYEVGHFDIIWASPPCTEYSLCLTSRPRDFSVGDPIVLKALEIIDYLKPTIWFVENPQTGYLKTRPFMKDIPFYDVSYCKYGHPLRKQTRIWTNLKDFCPKVCKQDCENMENGKHKNGRAFFDNKKSKRMIIPQPLITSLFECATHSFQQEHP